MHRITTFKKSPGIILALILALCFSCNSPSKTKSQLSKEALKEADKKMEAYVEKGKLSGISLLILQDGKAVHQNTFGLSNIEEGRPLDKDAIFRIYSMSKPITAAALMMLYEEGKFELDDPVAQYIPEFENTMVWENGNEVPQKEAFTIRQLLTHTAGFCYGMGESHVDSLYNQAYQGGLKATRNLESMIKVLAVIPLKNQPGKIWEYSVSIDVAGYLVEVLSGKTFDVFLQTRLFDPLKMEDTGFEVPKEDFGRLAMIYSENKDSGNLTPVEGLTNEVMKPAGIYSGGGGLVSTIGDYARFGQMLLNGGELDGVRVLEESTVKLIMTDQMPSTASYHKGMGYGLGGQVNNKTAEYSWSGMAATYFVLDPENDMMVLAFTQYVPNSKYKFAYEYMAWVREALENQ